jgi:hypothetical protein
MLCKSQRDKDESQYCQRAAVSAEISRFRFPVARDFTALPLRTTSAMWGQFCKLWLVWPSKFLRRSLALIPTARRKPQPSKRRKTGAPKLQKHRNKPGPPVQFFVLHDQRIRSNSPSIPGVDSNREAKSPAFQKAEDRGTQTSKTPRQVRATRPGKKRAHYDDDDGG